jgi:hypothetical protein
MRRNTSEKLYVFCAVKRQEPQNKYNYCNKGKNNMFEKCASSKLKPAILYQIAHSRSEFVHLFLKWFVAVTHNHMGTVSMKQTIWTV